MNQILSASARSRGLKGFFARVLGIDGQLQALSDRIHVLSMDPAFGIYTRQALQFLADHQPRGERLVIFLDFDRIHELNEEIGYEEVNKRIKYMLRLPMRSGDLVGRWFSGDEIVMVLDTTKAGNAIQRRLREAADEVGMTFTAAMGLWHSGDEPLKDAVARLSPLVLKRKQISAREKTTRRVSHVLLSTML
jgi:GGDEF domain-containing protein